MIDTVRIIDTLNNMYDSGDEQVRLLYKYRTCDPHNIDCLRNDTLWFSTAPQLNDPFDCLVRLPTTISDRDVENVRIRLSDAEPYRLEISEPREIVDYIASSDELRPLVPLGLMAKQMKHNRLLDHIRDLQVNSDVWTRQLIDMALDLAETFLHNMTVFCVSERNDHQLMWAHYAASHTGFCTGYVCPVGILNPQLIHRVNYINVPPKITAWQLVGDPSSVWSDLTLTKPSEWLYEHEWRVTFGNIPGLIERLLPYREVIIGAKTSPENVLRIRDAIEDRDVKIFRALADPNADEFEIKIEED